MKKILLYLALVVLFSSFAYAEKVPLGTITINSAGTFELMSNTEQCLTDCEMVLKYTTPLSTDGLSKTKSGYGYNLDIQKYSSKLPEITIETYVGVEKTTLIDIPTFENYSDTSYYDLNLQITDCKDIGATLDIGKGQCSITNVKQRQNGTVQQNRKNIVYEKVNLETYAFLPNATYYIKYFGKKKPTLGKSVIDFVPKFSNNELTEFAFWDSDWTYKKTISLTNSTGAAIAKGFVVDLNIADFNTTDCLAQGKCQADLDDIRIIANVEGVQTQIPFYIETDSNVNNIDTNRIWFALQYGLTDGVATAGNGDDTNNGYSIYYGNGAAVAATLATKFLLPAPDANVASDYNTTVFAWHMEEGSGRIFVDSKHNADLTTDYTDANYLPLIAGQFGRGFTNTQDYNATISYAFTALTGYTLEAWVKATDYSNNDGIVQFGTAQTAAGAFSLSHQGVRRFSCLQNDGGGADEASQPAGELTNGTLYHVACDWNGTALGLYVDGVIRGSVASGVLSANPTIVKVGKFETSNYYDGIIDEIRFSNYSKTKAGETFPTGSQKNQVNVAISIGSEQQDTGAVTANFTNNPSAPFLDVAGGLTSVNVDMNDTSTTSAVGGQINSWLWKVNNVQQSTTKSFVYTFTAIGDYNVSLRAGDTNNNFEQKDRTITVTNLHADFYFSPSKPILEPYADQNTINVDMNDVSLHTVSISTYVWRINGTQQSTDQNFRYNFTASGDYNVSLRITDANSNSRQRDANVTVRTLSPQFTYSPATFVLNPEGGISSIVADFNDLSIHSFSISAWLWKVNSVQQSTDQNFRYTFSSSGDYNVSLRITDANSNSRPEDKNITVGSFPQGLDINSSFLATAATADVNYGVTSTSSVNYFIWGFPNDQNQTGRYARFNYRTGDTRQVCVVANGVGDVNKVYCETFYDTRVIVKIPKNIVTLNNVTPFSPSVNIVPAQSYSGVSLDQNFWFFYQADFNSYNATIDTNTSFYISTHAINLGTTDLNKTIQPYVVPVTDGVQVTFTSKDSLTSEVVPTTQIDFSRNISSVGNVIVQSGITDSTGRITLSFIPNIDHNFSKYYPLGNLIQIGTYTPVTIDATDGIIILVPSTITVDTNALGNVDINFLQTIQVNVKANGTVDLNQIVTSNRAISSITITIDHNGVQLYTDTNSGAVASGGIFNQNISVAGLDRTLPLVITYTFTFAGGGTQTISQAVTIKDSTTTSLEDAFVGAKDDLGGLGGTMFLAAIIIAILLGALHYTIPQFDNSHSFLIASVILLFLSLFGWVGFVDWILASILGGALYFIRRVDV